MTVTIPEADSLTLLALDFEHAPECEHSTHGIQNDRHAGPAKWLQTMEAPLFCGHRMPAIYVCDAWHRHALTVDWLLCQECGTPAPADYLIFTRINREA